MRIRLAVLGARWMYLRLRDDEGTLRIEAEVRDRWDEQCLRSIDRVRTKRQHFDRGWRTDSVGPRDVGGQMRFGNEPTTPIRLLSKHLGRCMFR